MGDLTTPADIALTIARFLELTAALVAAGSGIYATLIDPQWRPRMLVPALGSLLAAHAIVLVLLARSIDESIAGAAGTADGQLLLLRGLIAATALAPALQLRGPHGFASGARIAVALVFVALAASAGPAFSIALSEPTSLGLLLDMVHVTALAVWIGAVAELLLVARAAGAHVDGIARANRWITGSIVVALATAVATIWRVPDASPATLLDVPWGRLAAAKLVVLVGIVPLTVVHVRTFAARVGARPDDAPRMLRQYCARELALLLVVVALTTWLAAAPAPT